MGVLLQREKIPVGQFSMKAYFSCHLEDFSADCDHSVLLRLEIQNQ